MMHESNECEILKNQNMEMNKVNNTPFKAEDVNWDELEKPRDFDPFGHAGFAHLWLQYD